MAMALCSACSVFWQASLLLAMSSLSFITSRKRSSLQGIHNASRQAKYAKMTKHEYCTLSAL